MNRRNSGKSPKMDRKRTTNSRMDKDSFEKSEKFKGRTRDTKMCANDPQWYIRENQLAKDVASISFNTAVGVPTSIDPDFGSSTAGFQAVKYSMPGIMTIHTVAAPGYAYGPTDPVNIAAKNLYSFIRHANSGHSNYDSPDLMLYFLAMDSAFNLIYHLQRVLGVATLFSQKNRYIGDALIQSMGINASNFRENIAQYRARLNMAIVKASVFAIPSDFTLFKRHAWMYSNIFADNPVDKAQLYLYIPSIVHKYVETDGAGYLEATPAFVSQETTSISPRMLNFGTAVNILETLLGALQGSEDINIMSGDILKAYGPEKIYKLALVPEDYTIAPMYSEEVLDQIHNTRFTGIYPKKRSILPDDYGTTTLETLNITQDPNINAGNLIFSPVFGNAMHLSYEAILDMSDNEPTPERVLVATRNTIGGMSMRVGNENKWVTYLTSFASDIPLFATIWRTTESGTLGTTNIYTSTTVGSMNVTSDILRAFNKAPYVYYGSVDTSTGDFTLNVPFGDVENYTLIGQSTLDKMHQSAILSMLGVPV